MNGITCYTSVEKEQVMLEKMADEVFAAIHRSNQEISRDSIPHTDSLIKDLYATHGIDAIMFQRIIGILKEAHKIFVIEISKEDKERKIERIQGYVDADLTTIRRLKAFYQEALIEMYEEEIHSRQLYHQIVQQIFPRMNIISNTPLGYIANKAIMLEEFEKLIQAQYREYTEDWKIRKLREVLEREDTIRPTAPVPGTGKESEAREEDKKRRAVDSDRYEEFAKASSRESVNHVLGIFGIEFFLRVNLRKNNFNYISEMVENRTIDTKTDLAMLQNMVKKVKNNMKNDTSLVDYMEDIYRLERTVSKFIHLSKNA